jgi:adenylyl- and sulfurtransferase ThiI
MPALVYGLAYWVGLRRGNRVDTNRLTLLRAEYERAIKDALIEAGLDVVEGKRFRVTVNPKSRFVLDSASIAEELGDAFVSTHSKLSTWTEVRVVSR